MRRLIGSESPDGAPSQGNLSRCEEPERHTLNSHCQAWHEGGRCWLSAVPRAAQKFERLYQGRTAVERVTAQLKIFWADDGGNVPGSRRFCARVGPHAEPA